MSRLIFLESLSEPFCCSNLGHRQISPLFQRKHNAQISYASKERRRHIFRGVKSSMYQDKQICCHQVYEKQLQQYRPGDQLTGDSGIAEALSSSQCCQTSRSPLRPANRETRSGVRAYGHEHIRAHSRTTQLCGRRSDKKLHVSANERFGRAPQLITAMSCTLHRKHTQILIALKQMNFEKQPPVSQAYLPP
uniref:Uncharacterized protein n=1 Tax=Physcomitrium patens TaxID=3218 RepID=A0A7I4A9T9_PHYPA